MIYFGIYIWYVFLTLCDLFNLYGEGKMMDIRGVHTVLKRERKQGLSDEQHTVD